MKDVFGWVVRIFNVHTLRQARRVVVGIVGTAVLLVGVALLVLPGPAILVIPLGLGILATEFVWARRWLRKAKQLFEKNKPQPDDKPAEVDRALSSQASSGKTGNSPPVQRGQRARKETRSGVGRFRRVMKEHGTG